MRDDGKHHGIETEKKLFQTEHPGWKKAGSKMVESGVGVDFFIAAPGGVYMDIATIGKSVRDVQISERADMQARTCLGTERRRDILLSKLPLS